MNFVLTSVCNKNCSFCFAQETIKSEKEIFNFNFLKQLITEVSTVEDGLLKYDNIKLLGGEPTFYDKFNDLMSWLIELSDERKRNKLPMISISLVSNFLFKDENTGNLISEYMYKNNNVSLLLNSSEFNNENQFNLFIKNINTYTKNLKNNSITFGFTMFSNNTFDYHEKILNRIYDDYITSIDKDILPPSIRLSMPNPENGSVSFNDIISEIPTYRKLMKDFIKWGKDHDIKVNFDCGLFRCLFDDELIHYSSNWSNGTENMGCDSAAIDVFPNGDIINCYPGKNLFKSNYYKYNNIFASIEEISLKRNYFKSIDGVFPEICLHCNHLGKQCKGPCLGYFNKPSDSHDEILMN